MALDTRAERKGRSHERILDSAARLLRAKGISGARVADVMASAGLTVGGFYAHFDSKQALVDDALRRIGARSREALLRRLDEKAPKDRAEVLLKRYLSTAHRDAPAEGCPLPAVVGEVGTTAPEHAGVVGEQVDAMAAALEAILPAETAIPRGTLALGLVALMYGGLSLSRALRGTPLSDEMLKVSRALGSLALRAEADR
jgi:TetR/AcrR family transcriptional repressor of nem operon